MLSNFRLRGITSGLRKEHACREHFFVSKAYHIMRPVHRTARSQVCFLNLPHLLIRWPALPKLVTNTRHLIFDAFTLLWELFS